MLQETERQSVTTDVQGRFSVTVSHGTVRLLASKEGFTGIQPEGHERPASNGILVTVRAGQQLKGLTLRVFPAGSVAGRVFERGEREPGDDRAARILVAYGEDCDRSLEQRARFDEALLARVKLSERNEIESGEHMVGSELGFGDRENAFEGNLGFGLSVT